MADTDLAYVARESCGCVVGVMTAWVKAHDRSEYRRERSRWNLWRLSVETVTVEQARAALLQTSGTHLRGPCDRKLRLEQAAALAR